MTDSSSLDFPSVEVLSWFWVASVIEELDPCHLIHYRSKDTALLLSCLIRDSALKTETLSLHEKKERYSFSDWNYSLREELTKKRLNNARSRLNEWRMLSLITSQRELTSKNVKVQPFFFENLSEDILNRLDILRKVEQKNCLNKLLNRSN